MALRIENDPFLNYDKWLEGDSVKWIDMLNGWMVVGREDVKALTADMERFSVKNGYIEAKGDAWNKIDGSTVKKFSTSFLRFLDSPKWDKIRWIHDAVLPYSSLSGPDSRPEAHRLQMEKIVNDHLESYRNRDHIDAMQEWCMPIPCRCAMSMLGVPMEDFPKLRDLIIDGLLMLVRNPPENNFWSDEAVAKANNAAEQLIPYIEGLIASKKAEPANDFISRMIAYNDKQDDKNKATDFELVQIVGDQLMGGFHESSFGLLADGLYLLLTSGQYRELVEDPSLIPAAVEETLRMHNSSPILPRLALVDVEIDGKTIKKGDHVFINLGAAQRDPSAFENHNIFNMHRPGESNGDLSFGIGAHRCPGQPQIRMVANAFFAAVTKMFPEIRLQAWPENMYTSIKYQPRSDVILLESLPVALKSR